MGEAIISFGGFVLLGIGAVDPIDIGRLEHGLGAQLRGAQDCRGVGGEERIAGAAGKNHHVAVVEVSPRAGALVGLADGGHGERRQGAHLCAGLRDRGFERQRVHDGRQHAHEIAGDARDATFRAGDAAEHVAAPHHNPEIDPERARGREIGSDARQRGLMDAEAAGPGQRLAGDFYDHAAVDRLSHAAFAC